MAQHSLRLASDVPNIPKTSGILKVAEHLPDIPDVRQSSTKVAESLSEIPDVSKITGVVEHLPGISTVPKVTEVAENLPGIPNEVAEHLSKVPDISKITAGVEHLPEIPTLSRFTDAIPANLSNPSDAGRSKILPNILGKLKNIPKLGANVSGNHDGSGVPDAPGSVNLDLTENEEGMAKSSKISQVFGGLPSRLKAIPNLIPFKKTGLSLDSSTAASDPVSGVSVSGYDSAYVTREGLDGTPSNDPAEDVEGMGDGNGDGYGDNEEASLLGALGEKRGIFERLLIGICVLVIVITFPITLCMCVKVIQQYERAVIFRCGRLVDKGTPKGPGIIFFIPCLDEVVKLDMRVITLPIQAQEILTNDSVTLTIESVIYYRIKDVKMAVLHVNKISESASQLACTAFRKALGTRNMRDILLNLDDISTGVLNKLNQVMTDWGVIITRVELKNVKLPLQMQRAMASEGEASIEARAKTLAADGELKSSKVLKEAADVMKTSPIALQLRYLQTLRTVASENSSTIIFPIPIDLLTPFVNAISPKY